MKSRLALVSFLILVGLATLYLRYMYYYPHVLHTLPKIFNSHSKGCKLTERRFPGVWQKLIPENYGVRYDITCNQKTTEGGVAINIAITRHEEELSSDLKGLMQSGFMQTTYNEHCFYRDEEYSYGYPLMRMECHKSDIWYTIFIYHDPVAISEIDTITKILMDEL